jgi:hypothetical protein
VAVDVDGDGVGVGGVGRLWDELGMRSVLSPSGRWASLIAERMASPWWLSPTTSYAAQAVRHHSMNGP